MVLKARTKPPPEDRTDSTIAAFGAVAWSAKAPELDVWIVVSMFAAIEVSPNWVKLHLEVAPRE
jgi:hypothetical protein